MKEVLQVNMKKIRESIYPYLDIIMRVKKRDPKPFRPTLEPAVRGLNPSLLTLIQDCWHENPHQRPKIEIIKTVLAAVVKNR